MLQTIMCCCGNGLGSSFMLEINVKSALKMLEVDGVMVAHTSLSDLASERFDLIVCAKDLFPECSKYGAAIGLENIMSLDELVTKLKAYV